MANGQVVGSCPTLEAKALRPFGAGGLHGRQQPRSHLMTCLPGLLQLYQALGTQDTAHNYIF